MDEYIQKTVLFKKQLDKKKIIPRSNKEHYRIKQNIYEINHYSDLAKSIKMLPKEIQKKIYIYGMKDYWRNRTLDKTLKPLYQDHLDYVNKEKDKIYLKNIHFMHLDFNTLPENKQYISGCQCDYCKGHPQEDKDFTYNNINYDRFKFYYSIDLSNISPWGTGLLPKNWFNDPEQLWFAGDGENFDFMRGKFESPLDYSCGEAPLYFSHELTKI